ncbi:hypothetical protein EON65_51700 [archaeon]|nr:MAG: hypothetical protein EON65_51700 [archaeon]
MSLRESTSQIRSLVLDTCPDVYVFVKLNQTLWVNHLKLILLRRTNINPAVIVPQPGRLSVEEKKQRKRIRNQEDHYYFCEYLYYCDEKGERTARLTIGDKK